jgi:hypothetical protein
MKNLQEMVIQILLHVGETVNARVKFRRQSTLADKEAFDTWWMGLMEYIQVAAGHKVKRKEYNFDYIIRCIVFW